jgi:MFS family permease
MSTQTVILIAVAVIFISMLLILIIKFPSPTPQQFFIFRVILALAAAGIGAIIPGYINVEGTQKEIAFRAGGAIVLFLVVYLVNPGIAKSINLIKEIKKS